MKRLRIPQVLAVTLASGTAAAGLIVACGHGESPPQEAGPPITDGGCALFCIPDGTDAGVCPDPPPCADLGSCPAGCRPVG